jgi:osmotically-inducible protein OsmY
VNGVKGVINNIKIKSNIIDEVEKIDIERAMKRNWSIAQQAINIGVTGNKVTLSGTVHSWYEHDEAERIAWNAPGVGIVDNELQIAYGK